MKKILFVLLALLFCCSCSKELVRAPEVPAVSDVTAVPEVPKDSSEPNADEEAEQGLETGDQGTSSEEAEQGLETGDQGTSSIKSSGNIFEMLSANRVSILLPEENGSNELYIGMSETELMKLMKKEPQEIYSSSEKKSILYEDISIILEEAEEECFVTNFYIFDNASKYILPNPLQFGQSKQTLIEVFGKADYEDISGGSPNEPFTQNYYWKNGYQIRLDYDNTQTLSRIVLGYDSQPERRFALAANGKKELLLISLTMEAVLEKLDNLEMKYEISERCKDEINFTEIRVENAALNFFRTIYDSEIRTLQSFEIYESGKVLFSESGLDLTTCAITEIGEDTIYGWLTWARDEIFYKVRNGYIVSWGLNTGDGIKIFHWLQ